MSLGDTGAGFMFVTAMSYAVARSSMIIRACTFAPFSSKIWLFVAASFRAFSTSAA
jgi:hypothetical protein